MNCNPEQALSSLKNPNTGGSPIPEPVVSVTENVADDGAHTQTQETSHGVVSHQDTFTEPAMALPDENTPPENGNSQPVTIFAISIDSMESGLHGGIQISFTSVFNQKLRMLVRKVLNVHHAREITHHSLSQVMLKKIATDLFYVGWHEGRQTMPDQQWMRHLSEIVFPIIEDMAKEWIGSNSEDIPNPVHAFFYGPNGLLNGSIYQEDIIRRLETIRDDTIIPLLTQYKGPAIIVVLQP